MKKTLIAVTAVATLMSAPSQAQDQQQPGIDLEKSQRMLEEGAKRLIDALGFFMQSIPTYEMPEVLPNGDIIIRPSFAPGKRPNVTHFANFWLFLQGSNG